MDFDYGHVVTLAKDIWWFLSVPLASVAVAGMYYLRHQFPTKKEYDEQNEALTVAVTALSDKIDANESKTVERIGRSEREMSDRMLKLESDVRQLPGRSEMETLSDRISRVETQVAASVETIRGVEKTINKIDHTLSMMLGHMLDAKTEKSS